MNTAIGRSGIAALWWESVRQSGVFGPAANLVVANLLTHAGTDVLGAKVTPKLPSLRLDGSRYYELA
jgi:hypothetical protein